MNLEQRIQAEIDGQIEWLRNDALRKLRSSLEEVNREVEELPAVKLGKTDNKYLPAVIPSPFKYCDFYCECHAELLGNSEQLAQLRTNLEPTCVKLALVQHTSQ